MNMLASTLPTTASKDTLLILAKSVYDSPALKNRFYDTWMSEKLSIDQIAVFARNYGEFIRRFPEVLATMIMSTDDVVARTEYAKTLYSEMGYGVFEKVHSVLFQAWLDALATQFGEPEGLSWDLLLKSYPLLPETVSLIEGEKRLYSSDNATGSGAQLALEWQAYTMLRQLYDGATLYKEMWAVPDDFHESCEYFYAHIGAAEKEHKIESLNGARQFDVSTAERTKIEGGFHTHLTLFANFWNALAKSIGEMNKPFAA